MISKNVYVILVLQFLSLVTSESVEPAAKSIQNVTDSNKEGKLLSLFNVIQFPNDICSGGTRNGTCFTAEECTNIGGTNDGTCASGFGVCCIIVLSCGGSSSQNCTYIEQASATTFTDNPCQYTINRLDSDVCRIRFDLTTFSIAAPTTGTVLSPATLTITGTAIGDCTTDAFTITSPGSAAPPMICGFNTGQHLFVDASDEGHILSFFLSGTTTSRSWTIKATQYNCGNHDIGGPPGCLQYFTASTGTVSSFNFPTTSTTITSTATHLSSQNYNMCFRRTSGNCAICWTPAIVPATAAVIDQQSFGLSVSPDPAAAQSGVDSECISDYLGVTNGVTAAIAAISTITTTGIYRVCGRVFAPTTGATAVIANTVSVCTRTRPFRLLFYSDGDETVGVAVATTNELDEAPGGIVGFSLNFAQLSC